MTQFACYTASCAGSGAAFTAPCTFSPDAKPEHIFVTSRCGWWWWWRWRWGPCGMFGVFKNMHAKSLGPARTHAPT